MGFDEMEIIENLSSLHIPRPSLSSSSQSSDSIRRFSTGGIRNQKRIHHHNNQHHHHNRKGSSSHSSSASSSINSRSQSHNLEKIHRGSRSSQGSSSDGNLSLHSTSSLLLSVQNLEKFTKLQERRTRSQNDECWTHQKSHHDQHVIEVDETAVADNTSSPPPHHHHPHHPITTSSTTNTNNNKKAKELDQISIASSTHFTMVNGFGRSNIRTKSNSICRQGRQITVLIVTMSSLFMIAIITVIYLMDRRARTMPAYHQ